ncbi:putative membrane protein [Wolbachia endosymbiont of Trichogramma pretiosum]|nr:putative membrane protein [Wolbachia endosymbiont of Trichogramma pretiosum]
MIVCFPVVVSASIVLFVGVAALKACYLLFKRYDIFLLRR